MLGPNCQMRWQARQRFFFWYPVRAAVSSGCQPRLPRCRAQAAASRAKSFPGLGTQAEPRTHLQTIPLCVLGLLLAEAHRKQTCSACPAPVTALSCPASDFASQCRYLSHMKYPSRALRQRVHVNVRMTATAAVLGRRGGVVAVTVPGGAAAQAAVAARLVHGAGCRSRAEHAAAEHAVRVRARRGQRRGRRRRAGRRAAVAPGH